MALSPGHRRPYLEALSPHQDGFPVGEGDIERDRAVLVLATLG